MNKENVIKYLEFRAQFTPRQWHELERAIQDKFKEKADQLELDDSDIKSIVDRIENNPFIQ